MGRHWLAPGEEEQEVAYEALRAFTTPLLRRLLAWISLEGVEHVPHSGPALIVSNHRSLLDPLLIGLGLERHVHFVADSWLGRLLGPMLRPSGVLFLPVRSHRTDALLEGAGEALRHGQVVGIFPEGMENFLHGTPPRSVAAFHSAFARLWWQERSLAVPIVPAAIVGSWEERRLGLPGWLFSALDPCSPQFLGRQVGGVLYRTATVRFGPPLAVPHAAEEEAFVAALTEQARAAVLELMG